MGKRQVKAMYNRYIPQTDGTYQKMKYPENPSGKPLPPAPPLPPPGPKQTGPKPPEPVSAASFFHQLLPANFDTEDLIIVLLLLLMSEKCRESQNTALLTMVLYLFL